MRGIVAKIQVKAGREAEFETLAAELVAASRREAGCLAYELWRADGDGAYAFIERYVDEAAAQAHVKADHYRRIGRQMGALMEGAPTVIRLAALGEGGGLSHAAPGLGAGADGEDSERASLVAQWLRHFGVVEATELDLGTLGAVRRFVEEGVGPPGRG